MNFYDCNLLIFRPVFQWFSMTVTYWFSVLFFNGFLWLEHTDFPFYISVVFYDCNLLIFPPIFQWFSMTVTYWFPSYISVIFYDCNILAHPATDCSLCKSLRFYQPYYHCRWWTDRCVFNEAPNQNKDQAQCPDPVINKVSNVSLMSSDVFIMISLL